MSYTYDCKTKRFTFDSDTLAKLIYRVATPKEKLEIEDAKENAARIARTRTFDVSDV